MQLVQAIEDPLQCGQNKFHRPSVSTPGLLSSDNKHPSIKPFPCSQKMHKIHSKAKCRVDSLSWSSVSDITLSFLKLGICPRVSTSTDELSLPLVESKSKSQVKKCSKCRKRKKRLHDEQSNSLMFKQADELEIPEDLALSLSHDFCPSDKGILPSVVKSYAKIIDSFEEENGLSNVDIDLKLEDVNNILQSKIFVKSPTKEYSFKMRSLKKPCDQMTIMSPYSPPSSVNNKDLVSKMAEDITRVRKNIFRERCDLCHNYISKPKEVKTQKPEPRTIKTMSDNKSDLKISQSRNQRLSRKSLLSSKRDDLGMIPVVFLTRLEDLGFKEQSKHSSRHPTKNSVVIKKCSVILEKLDDVCFRKYFHKYQTRKNFIEFLRTPTKTASNYGIMTRSQKKFLS